jgi:hypothetical protein
MPVKNDEQQFQSEDERIRAEAREETAEEDREGEARDC